MISDSPQSYFQAAPEHVPRDVLERAVQQARRVEQHGLTAVLTLGHLSQLTGVHYMVLREIITRRTDPYHEFDLRKNGSNLPRKISSPQPQARRVQKWILRNILNRALPHQSSYAYQPGRSIGMCAERHLGARWMLKMDMHDFFHAIDETQVFEVFRKLGYEPLISLEMSRLCTRMATNGFPFQAKYARIHRDTENDAIPEYRAMRLGFLPQGSPTSGALANLSAGSMDQRIELIAARVGVTYTRYADDMTFSTRQSFSRSRLLSLHREVSGTVQDHGFEVHHKKTRIVPPGARKVVLGLLVDGERVRLTQRTRRRIDEHLRCATKFGCGTHAARRGFSDVLGFIRHQTGLLHFALDVDRPWAEPRMTQWEYLLGQQGFKPSRLYWL